KSRAYARCRIEQGAAPAGAGRVAGAGARTSGAGPDQQAAAQPQQPDAQGQRQRAQRCAGLVAGTVRTQRAFRGRSDIMKASVLTKLDTLSERFEELSRLLSDADTIADQKRFRDLSKE